MNSSRRWLLAIPLLVVAAFSDAREFDPSKPEDALQMTRKFICTLEDGKTVLSWWQGTAMSRVPGERDRVLFKVQGMNIRQCGSFNDPKRGPGFRSVSREVMLYLDPETGAVLDEWTNPWTGEKVKVVHVQNDPVNMRQPMHAYGPDGTPHVWRGEMMRGLAWMNSQVPLYYENPLAGGYQDYVGGKYHAIEMFNSFVPAKALLDPDVKTIDDFSIGWQRVSNWLPWMKMGDRAGLIVFSTVGKRARDVDALPEPLRTEIRTRFPLYQGPPPLDDARPNETSWTYFGKVTPPAAAGKH